MKSIWRVIAIMLVFAGAIWFLQGINILPGSYMTGQLQWAVYGSLAMIAGIALLVFAGRR